MGGQAGSKLGRGGSMGRAAAWLQGPRTLAQPVPSPPPPSPAGGTRRALVSSAALPATPASATLTTPTALPASSSVLSAWEMCGNAQMPCPAARRLLLDPPSPSPAAIPALQPDNRGVPAGELPVSMTRIVEWSRCRRPRESRPPYNMHSIIPSPARRMPKPTSSPSPPAFSLRPLVAMPARAPRTRGLHTMPGLAVLHPGGPVRRAARLTW